MSEETKPTKKRVRINHTYPEVVQTRVANHFVVQHDDESFILSFFEIQQPIILGDTRTEIESQLDLIEEIEAKCVARLVLTPARMDQFMAAIQDNFQKFESKASVFDDLEESDSEEADNNESE